MPKWDSIIIHHSATPDDGWKRDFESICKYHMSWRLKGHIIDAALGKQLLRAGEPVEKPWSDIGYHWVVEMVEGHPVIKKGRSLERAGAHCTGMNNRAIGICCPGDFDKTIPSEMIYFSCADLCAQMIRQFTQISVATIYPHSKFSSKTCPGVMFDMNRLVQNIGRAL